eukprot:gene20376-27146_t
MASASACACKRALSPPAPLVPVQVVTNRGNITHPTDDCIAMTGRSTNGQQQLTSTLPHAGRTSNRADSATNSSCVPLKPLALMDSLYLYGAIPVAGLIGCRPSAPSPQVSDTDKLRQKWRARDFELHRNAVKTAKSGTDSTAPLAMSMTHVRPGNAKQTYFKELKEKAISQENARLIGESRQAAQVVLLPVGLSSQTWLPNRQSHPIPPAIPTGKVQAEVQLQNRSPRPGAPSPTPGGSDPDAPAGDIAQALEQSVISDQISDLRSQVDSQLQASEGIEIITPALAEALVALFTSVLAQGCRRMNNAALTTEECDMELRLLCWQTASLGCKLEAAALTAATNIGFVGVLLLHMDLGAESSPSIRRWNSDQLATLRTAAISRLYEVAPLCPEQYISAGGFGIMLAFLTASLQAVGGGGLGPSKGHILGALRHMHRLCVAVPAACETLGAQGAIPMLIDLVRQAPQASPKPDGGIRHLSLLLLSALCSCPPMEGSNTSNIRRFRQEGGVQVLEVGNRDHRPITVSLLADLLVNPKSHSFFHDWRSDLDKKSAANMLLAIWKEEDALRGMTSKQGFLSNTSRPLTGKGTRERWVPSDTLAYGNLDPKRRDGMQLIKDACSGDKLLEKLYAVFKVVGLDTMSYLSTHDQCTLVMVEKYVKFRQGEMWRELDLEFEQEGMRPTSPDRVRLDSGIELAEHIARAVVDAQSQILGKYTATIRSQEQKHLDSMLAQRKYEQGTATSPSNVFKRKYAPVRGSQGLCWGACPSAVPVLGSRPLIRLRQSFCTNGTVEQEMRFYQKDRSQLTLAELREAKRKKEEMLKNSIKSFAVLDDEV